MDELTILQSHNVREFPARNMFLYQFFQMAKQSRTFKEMDFTERDYIINQTGLYVFNICKSVSIVARDRPDVVLSFIMYVDSPIGPVIYFAYTKEDVRKKGFIRNLLDTIGIEKDDEIMICYTGPVPTFLSKKIIKKRLIL